MDTVLINPNVFLSILTEKEMNEMIVDYLNKACSRFHHDKGDKFPHIEVHRIRNKMYIFWG